jgi:hypothetical protein
MDYIQAILGLFCLGAIKVLDLTDPDTIFWARCAFACGSALTLLTLAILYLRISSTNDTQQLILTQAELNPPPPFAAALGAPPAPDANKQTTVTHKEYDLLKLRTLAQTAATTIAITTALHLWKGFMPPLILQSVLGMANVLSSELASLYLFGQTAKQNPQLKRPFKVKSMFAAFTDLKKEMQSTMSTDNKPARKNKKAENMKAVGKSR